MPRNRKPRSAHELRQIAVLAEVDPRTVERVLANEPTRPMVQARVKRAIDALKLAEKP